MVITPNMTSNRVITGAYPTRNGFRTVLDCEFVPLSPICFSVVSVHNERNCVKYVKDV